MTTKEIFFIVAFIFACVVFVYSYITVGRARRAVANAQRLARVNTGKMHAIDETLDMYIAELDTIRKAAKELCIIVINDRAAVKEKQKRANALMLLLKDSYQRIAEHRL